MLLSSFHPSPTNFFTLCYPVHEIRTKQACWLCCSAAHYCIPLSDLQPLSTYLCQTYNEGTLFEAVFTTTPLQKTIFAREAPLCFVVLAPRCLCGILQAAMASTLRVTRCLINRCVWLKVMHLNYVHGVQDRVACSLRKQSFCGYRCLSPTHGMKTAIRNSLGA